MLVRYYVSLDDLVAFASGPAPELRPRGEQISGATRVQVALLAHDACLSGD